MYNMYYMYVYMCVLCDGHIVNPENPMWMNIMCLVRFLSTELDEKKAQLELKIESFYSECVRVVVLNA